MKIEYNNDISKFFINGNRNILKCIQSFDHTINIRDTQKVNKILEKHGYNSTRDLIVNEKLILKNPYYKNIKLKNTDNKVFKFEEEIIPKNHAINISWVQPDEKKEMNDFIRMGYFKSNVKVPTLKQVTDKGEITWMSPTLAEQNTIDPFINKNAKGNILTFGLGIGYFIYMASLKEEVESITIVEYSQEVIDMFTEVILPQFETKKEIKIIKGNAFEYFNKNFLDKFDYIFVDIWENNEDGFEIIQKLLEQENYKGNIDYWVEFSCYMHIRMLMFLYLRSLAQGNIQQFLLSFIGKDRELLTKIHRYFRQKEHIVTDVNELKHYLYDIETIREIISIKL